MLGLNLLPHVVLRCCFEPITFHVSTGNHHKHGDRHRDFRRDLPGAFPGTRLVRRLGPGTVHARAKLGSILLRSEVLRTARSTRVRFMDMGDGVVAQPSKTKYLNELDVMQQMYWLHHKSLAERGITVGLEQDRNLRWRDFVRRQGNVIARPLDPEVHWFSPDDAIRSTPNLARQKLASSACVPSIPKAF